MNKHSQCKGKGFKEKTVSQDVKIPKGVNTGTVLKIPMGNGGGNVLVKIKVAEHPYFSRKGYDIHTDKLITITQAVLGCRLEVATVYGKKSIDVKPGTASGSVFTIPKYGVKKDGASLKPYGDHHVHLTIKIPTSLSKEQKSVMREYAEIESPIFSDDPAV